ncbi:MAG TPA: FAD-dependent oxidoreductase [Patescibacteria group bacterium]|nr:FAD-dependent oxidoreductase [Patescibacteria group bacterium]
MKKLRIAVIGGGLTGCCSAASLHDIAEEITVFESDPLLMDEASFYNEGRIHLGYTYGMDKSLDTVRLMAKTAVVFEKLLVRWFGSEISKVPRSSPFNYTVHKNGLMNGDEYANHARRVGEIVRGVLEKDDTCFGVDLKKMPHKLSSAYMSSHYDINNIISAFETNEISVDPEAIAEIIRKNILKIPRVNVRPQSEVLRIHVDGSKYKIEVRTTNSKPSTETFDCVINASGRDLLRLDAFLGLKPPEDPLFRLKYLIRTKTKDIDLPSSSVVLGMFGEVVSFEDYMTLAWYPAGRLDWYQGLAPKKAEPILKEEPAATNLKAEIVRGLSTIVPKLKNMRFDNSELKGNWIFAPGTSDVNNPKSRLHKRTDVGIRQVGNYFSIDPGKYTTAPYFANELAKRFL